MKYSSESILSGIVLFLIFVFISCNTDLKEKASDFDYEDGLYVEHIDTVENIYDNPYNWDNTIYTAGKEFIFDYYFIDAKGDTFKFSREGYDLKPLDQLTTKTIVALSIIPSATLETFGADYYQTETEYRYYLPDGSLSWPRSTSGVIENKKNVWMHPFRREKYFKIMQINPFPFIQAPFEVGHHWEWSLKIGGQWGDVKWIAWEGGINNKQHYEIVDFSIVETALGPLACYIVDAKGESELGNTALRSFFNTTYGFVKFEYTNIDDSRLVMWLKEVRAVSSDQN